MDVIGYKIEKLMTNRTIILQFLCKLVEPREKVTLSKFAKYMYCCFQKVATLTTNFFRLKCVTVFTKVRSPFTSTFSCNSHLKCILIFLPAFYLTISFFLSFTPHSLWFFRNSANKTLLILSCTK